MRRGTARRLEAAGFVRRFILHGAALSALVLAFPVFVAAQDDVPEIVKTLLAEGDRHRQAGRVEEAVETYEEARRLDPSVVETYVSLGALYHGEGDLERALEVFVGGLEHDPDEPSLLFNAAVLSRQLERPEAALGYVDRALDGNRRDANLHSLRSAALRDLDRLDEALEAQQSAAKLDPGSPHVLYRLGNIFYELGRRGEAIEAYSKATRKDKGYLRAWYNLGAALFEEGRSEEALDAYRVALKPVEEAFAAGEPVEPSNARAYLNLGAIHFQNENWPAALEAYGKAIELDPQQAGALYSQGFIHYRQGRPEAAAEAYRRALALDPELPLAYLHLGEIHAARGEAAAAVPLLEKAVEKLAVADRLTARRILGEARLALGETEAAREAFRAVLEEDPDDLETLVALGGILRDQGDAARARELLERARRLDPEHSGAALELAGLARAEGDRTRERTLYEDLLRGSGSAPELWPLRVNLARVLVEEGEDAAALAAFDPIVERLPELSRQGLDAGTADALATVYGLLLASLGRLDEAAARLGSIGRDGAPYPPAREAAAVIGMIDGGAGAGAAADVLAANLTEHRGDAFENEARANLGLALWLAGRPGEARPHLEQAARAFPGRAGVQLALGEIAYGEGRLERAVERLERASSGCAKAPDPGGENRREMRVVLGRTSSEPLCGRAAKSLATALVAAAFAELREGREPVSARALADRAIALPLTGEEHAVAHLVRGTARLLAGTDQGARADLETALAGGLPEPLRELAENNLGVALYRLGEVDEARRELESAGRGGGLLEAILNLGVLLDDAAGDNARALELYEAYLARGGRRRAEVETWAERLRKVYE